jgi:hypothetical protein
LVAAKFADRLKRAVEAKHAGQMPAIFAGELGTLAWRLPVKYRRRSAWLQGIRESQFGMFPNPAASLRKPWRKRVSVTSTSSTLPLAPAAQTGRPATETATKPGSAPAGEETRVPAPAQDEPVPSAPSSTAIGFSLSYDPTTGRMFLEAREPVSGFIIYQMPPKYVIKQFNATLNAIEPARGAQVDGAA